MKKKLTTSKMVSVVGCRVLGRMIFSAVSQPSLAEHRTLDCSLFEMSPKVRRC